MRYRLYILTFLLAFAAPMGMWAQADKSDLFVLEGHRQMMLGNLNDAFYLTRHALDLNPQSVAALEQMGEFMHFLRNDSASLDYMERAARYAPGDYWIQQPLVELYVSMGQPDKAIAKLEELAEQFPANEDVLMMLETLYKQKGDYANVVRLLDRLETKEGKSEQLSVEKFRTYMQMNDEERAFNEIKLLADEYPNDIRYRVLLGDMYANQQRYEEALAVYKAVEADDPDNLGLMVSMLNYYMATDQDSLYHRQLEVMSTNEKLDNDRRLQFLTSMVMENLQSRRDPQRLVAILEKVVDMPNISSDIAELCVKYMLTTDQPAGKVKPILNRILELDPENLLARGQLLQYAVDDNDISEIIRVSRPAVEFGLDDPAVYYYLGIAYLQSDSAQKSVNTFAEGFKHVKPETNLQLVTNMYALLGDAYHTLGDMRHAYEAYDSCLVYRPDEALVLNNYAYYLSLEHKQLDRAEEMSRRSLEKEGDNPTYIDTYAWILFQQKRYAEARKQIDRALELMGDDIDESDATVIEHAGDIYAKCGQMQQAVAFWQQSAQLGNTSALLAKKLKKQKYYAY